VADPGGALDCDLLTVAHGSSGDQVGVGTGPTLVNERVCVLEVESYAHPDRHTAILVNHLPGLLSTWDSRRSGSLCSIGIPSRIFGWIRLHGADVTHYRVGTEISGALMALRLLHPRPPRSVAARCRPTLATHGRCHPVPVRSLLGVHRGLAPGGLEAVTAE